MCTHPMPVAQIKRKKWICEHCGRKTSSKSNLKRHQEESCKVLLKDESDTEQSHSEIADNKNDTESIGNSSDNDIDSKTTEELSDDENDGNSEIGNIIFPVTSFKLTLENGGTLEIPARPSDAYINGTLLSQAGGKQFSEWKRNDSTDRLVSALARITQIPIERLIESNPGGYGTYRGSWIHPDLAVHLAQWVNPFFALQVSRWIRELLSTGKVEISESKAVQPVQLSLVPIRDAPHSFLDQQVSFINGVIYAFEHTGQTYMKGMGLNYIAYLGVYKGFHHFKFGFTKDPMTRFNDLRNDFTGEFFPILLKPGSTEKEQKFKTSLKAKGYLTKYKDFEKTEVFYIDEKFTLNEAIADLERILSINEEPLDHYESVKSQLDDSVVQNKITRLEYELKLSSAEGEIRELKMQLQNKDLQLQNKDLQLQNKDLQCELEILKLTNDKKSSLSY